jgi:hypothetical protein
MAEEEGVPFIHPRLNKWSETLSKARSSVQANGLQSMTPCAPASALCSISSPLKDCLGRLSKRVLLQGLVGKNSPKRLGLTELYIKRYEATAYASAGLARANAVMRVLGLKVREEVILPKPPWMVTKDEEQPA